MQREWWKLSSMPDGKKCTQWPYKGTSNWRSSIRLSSDFEGNTDTGQELLLYQQRENMHIISRRGMLYYHNPFIFNFNI